jgi:hypothetical protein
MRPYKHILCLLILAAFSLISDDLFAQGMHIPTTTRINTPYGPMNLPSQQYVRMPYMYHGNSGPYSAKYEFNVVMKNDSTFTVKTKIQWQDSVDYIEVKKGKEKIKIKVSETKQIWRRGLQTGRQITGIATDTCWLFPTIKGAINCYSFLAEPDQIEYTTAIQYGDDGEIVPLTKDNLLEITGQNDKAIMRQVKKTNLPSAVKIFNRKIAAEDAKREKKKRGSKIAFTMSMATIVRL